MWKILSCIQDAVDLTLFDGKFEDFMSFKQDFYGR